MIVITIITINKHCNEFFFHICVFRRHLDNVKQKTMLKSKYFEFFDFIEILIVKMHVDFKFEKIESRLREKSHNMHDDFAKFVKNAQFDKNQRRLSMTENLSLNFVIVVIVELSLIIKRIIFDVAK